MTDEPQEESAETGQGPVAAGTLESPLLESLPEAVLAVDVRGSTSLVNARAERLFGYARREMLGEPVVRLLPDGLPEPGPKPSGSHDVRARRSDGTDFAAEIAVSRVDTARGPMVAAIVRDVSERRRVEQELRRSKDQLAGAQSLARIGSWEWDVAANRVSWSDELYRIYGLDPGEVEPSYEELLERVHPDDRQLVEERNRKAFADHRPFDDVERIVRPDGSVFLMRTRGEVVTDDGGKTIRLIGVGEDATDRARAGEAVRAVPARSRLAAIVLFSGDAIIAHSPEGVIISWNPGAERLYGYTAEEAVGNRIEMLVPAGRADEEARMWEQLRERGRVDPYETQRVRKDATLVDVSLSVSQVLGPRGQIEASSWFARDVTERRQFEQRLRYLADHDALTDLFNRRRFEEELAAQVAQAERYGRGGAVLVLDIDNFKYVNDTFGHGSGDDLLRSLAALVRGRMRQTDVVARLGGDEFAILLPRASQTEARTVAEKLVKAVGESTVVASGRTLRATISIGAALFDDRHVPPDDLLAAAGRAMHEAKDTGRNRFVLETPERWQEANRRTRQGWEHRIHAALENDRLVLHCQPVLDLADGDVRQYELLLRLEDEEGVAPPGAFLGVAERLGLIQAIDRWVVGEAVGLLAEHSAAGRALKFEVNLSGRSIGDQDLTASIGRKVAAADVDPSALIFEITETAAIANMDEARRFAGEVTTAGCGFALDNFGTGFGSFHYLKYLPAEYLKIDGDFVSSPRSKTDELIVEAIVQVARDLGKHTVAEFVTDADAVGRMRELGVDYAQGYHVGRPFPVAELGARLNGGVGASG